MARSSRGRPHTDGASRPWLAPPRPAVLSRPPLPPSERPSRARPEPGRHTGLLERLRLRLDRPVAHPGQIKNRELEDEHHENELYHPTQFTGPSPPVATSHPAVVRIS